MKRRGQIDVKVSLVFNPGGDVIILTQITQSWFPSHVAVTIVIVAVIQDEPEMWP